MSISTRLRFQPSPHLVVCGVATKIMTMHFDIGLNLNPMFKIIYNNEIHQGQSRKGKTYKNLPVSGPTSYISTMDHNYFPQILHHHLLEKP